MSFLTQLLGGVLESTYRTIESQSPTSTNASAEQLAVKLVIVKGIVQDLSTANAVTFLQGADPELGPIAQQVVDAINGHGDSAGAIVAAMLQQAAQS